MPRTRISEDLKQNIEIAADHFDHFNDRPAGITLQLNQAHALVEIAAALKDIDSHLTEIAAALRTPTADRTTLEQPQATPRRSRKT